MEGNTIYSESHSRSFPWHPGREKEENISKE
jgi:hypothetical protein